ncbi:polysaccharide deacetylase family protein [Collimonas arenae]|uniref:Polysaccharide deacetylase family protein n=1 Tax=Collimonas arenae TaxID=279058 RepID=A0A127QMU9_9BURK|nr:polysaccharide deacetylase family protein [Collimonas arenae]AMP01472.1 polysaccharide deacetylase family protein [Collimonas arenae]AMP11374.1 polysaccharide deacetylase family protein [Collimonas arenae]
MSTAGRSKWNKVWLTLLVIAIVGAAAIWIERIREIAPARWSSDAIALILPDNLSEANRLYASAWLDAASEEGIRLETVTASEFARRGLQGERPFAGAILPDTIHRQISTAFVNQVSRFVEHGGALMLVGDAGVLDENGYYTEPASRFSTLAGIPYALYSKLHDKMSFNPTISGSPQMMQALNLPPGRWIESDGQAVVSGYGEDTLRYPVLHTGDTYTGTIRMQAQGKTVIAGEHAFGKGQVLFINLPLGYLKLRTDGILMHGFLHYFANRIMGQPQLSAAPEAIGGLVLNWHCDAKICIPAMEQLIKAGVFKRGPFSIHVTAGPDQREFGDGLGVDLNNNKPFQETLRSLLEQGNEIGSHGGWIHDWFGKHLSDSNEAQMTTYLEQNADAIKRLIGHDQTEYSAPTGNQPAWVTEWLDAQHVEAYYFTGNIGQGPTHTYRDGRRDGHIWSFPVQTYGHISTIEEAYTEHIPESEISSWLTSLVKFTENTGQIRLIYFHPPGAVLYPDAINQLMLAADAATKEGRFRWRTMTDLANFMSRREQTVWNISSGNQAVVIDAANAASLNQLTWLFSTSLYAEPQIIAGNAKVEQRGDTWAVIAADVKQLRISTPLIKKAPH